MACRTTKIDLEAQTPFAGALQRYGSLVSPIYLYDISPTFSCTDLRMVDDTIDAMIKPKHLRILEAHRVDHAEEGHGSVQIERSLGHPGIRFQVTGLCVTTTHAETS